MLQNVTPKGSIIYKILIVLLGIALVATIMYPGTLWKNEAKNTELCRSNMTHLMIAEYIYQANTNTFTDTLDNIIKMFKEDTNKAKLRMFVNADSVLANRIFLYFRNAKLQDQGISSSIVDTLLRKARRMDMDTTEAYVLDSLRTFSKFSRAIDSIAWDVINNFSMCPTIKRPYQIAIIDTSAFKVFNIYCPLTKEDSVNVASSFKLSKLGGLRISNHGKIESGLKSWEK